MAAIIGKDCQAVDRARVFLLQATEVAEHATFEIAVVAMLYLDVQDKLVAGLCHQLCQLIYASAASTRCGRKFLLQEYGRDGAIDQSKCSWSTKRDAFKQECVDCFLPKGIVILHDRFERRCVAELRGKGGGLIRCALDPVVHGGVKSADGGAVLFKV